MKPLSPEAKEIIDSLKPMFKEARKKHLMFRSHYQDLWFTPDELEEAQADGRFIWGPVNWELLPVVDKIARLEADIQRLKKEKDRFDAALVDYLDYERR